MTALPYTPGLGYLRRAHERYPPALERDLTAGELVGQVRDRIAARGERQAHKLHALRKVHNRPRLHVTS